MRRKRGGPMDLKGASRISTTSMLQARELAWSLSTCRVSFRKDKSEKKTLPHPWLKFSRGLVAVPLCIINPAMFSSAIPIFAPNIYDLMMSRNRYPCLFPSITICITAICPSSFWISWRGRLFSQQLYCLRREAYRSRPGAICHFSK